MDLRHKPLSVCVVTLVATSSFAATSMQTVIQQGRAFSEKTLQIAKGGVIRFSNVDKFTHQIYVESPSFNFESNEQPPGENVDVTFPKPGAFEVRCHIHPKMLLQVEVR